MSYDHAALKTIIDSDAANAAKSDADVLAWLEASVSHIGAISTKQLAGWCVNTDILRRLDQIADDVVPDSEPPTAGSYTDQMRGIARGMAIIIRQRESFDVGDPESQQLLAAAVANGTITSGERTNLETRATTTMPRWQDEGLAKPSLGDVIVARAL